MTTLIFSRRAIAVLALAALSVPACFKSADCESDQHAFTTVTLPATATAGQTVTLDATIGGDGCSESGNLSGRVDGQTVRLKGTVHNVGCVCTAILRPFPASFSFVPATAGTYIVEVDLPGGTVERDTLVVN